MSSVLVTAIGSFSADVVISNLINKGYIVYGCDIYPKEWVANSLIVKNFYQSPKATEKQKYIEFLLNVCEENCIKHLIPLTDVEIDILNENRALFDRKGFVLCMSQSRSIQLVRDKYKMYQFLNEEKIQGFSLIETKLMKDNNSSNIRFPCVVKMRNGRSSQGLHNLKDEQQLALFKQQNDIEKFIIQPLILGTVITVDVVRSSKTKKVVTVAREELLRTLNGAGTSVKIMNESKLDEIVIWLANKLEVEGCVNFEFIKHEKEYYLLECNPRFSGGVKFSCMAGYDFVINHMNCFEGNRIDEQVTIQEVYIARKYNEFIIE